MYISQAEPVVEAVVEPTHFPAPSAEAKKWLPRSGAAPAAKPQSYVATLEEIVQSTPDVRLFRLTLDGYREVMPFAAGQFVQILSFLPDPKNPGQKKKVMRSYSIASPPSERRYLEFCIKLVPEGGFTPTLWTMAVGDKIDVRGAYGKFLLPQPIEHDLLFLAAGTGIAPFYGMIHHALKSGVQTKLTLIAGVRHEENLLYVNEFRQLAAEHPNFTAVFTLSRPKLPQKWWGATGYVHAPDLLTRHVPTPARTKAYLCGLTPMIEHSRERLHALGLHKDHVHYERYD